MTRSAVDPDALAALEDQRTFLLDSLRDLEREHDAGDLDDADYRALRDDYTARAADVLRAIEGRRSAIADAHRPMSWARRGAILAVVAVFAVVAGFVVAGAVGSREDGGTLTGGVTAKSSPSQQAQACIQKIQPTAPSDALDCFQQVLKQDPRNPVALTWSAWTLELTTSFLDQERAAQIHAAAVASIEKAIVADPGYSPARAFRAILAFRGGHYEQAKAYLAEFRANDPSADAEAVIDELDLDGQIAQALGEAAPTTTTTTPISATTPTSTPGG